MELPEGDPDEVPCICIKRVMTDRRCGPWGCEVCQEMTWIQYKEEEEPVNCSLCMNKMILYELTSKAIVSNYNVSNAFIETV